MPASILADLDGYLPAGSSRKLWERAVAIANDDCLGIHVAMAAPVNAFDVHAYAMLSSPTLSGALYRVCRSRPGRRSVSVCRAVAVIPVGPAEARPAPCPLAHVRRRGLARERNGSRRRHVLQCDGGVESDIRPDRGSVVRDDYARVRTHTAAPFRGTTRVDGAELLALAVRRELQHPGAGAGGDPASDARELSAWPGTQYDAQPCRGRAVDSPPSNRQAPAGSVRRSVDRGMASGRFPPIRLAVRVDAYFSSDIQNPSFWMHARRSGARPTSRLRRAACPGTHRSMGYRSTARPRPDPDPGSRTRDSSHSPHARRR